MKIRLKTIEIASEIPLLAVSDFHMGNASRADNAIPSKNAINALKNGIDSGTIKGFLILIGDIWERWQFNKATIIKAWESMYAWLTREHIEGKKLIVLCGNHDQDMATDIDMLLIKWGKRIIGFVHDPKFEYRGWKKAIAKWAVDVLWTPWEKLLGWKKGIELSSALDSNSLSEYERATLSMLNDYFLDVIIYGHTHQKPFVRKTGTSYIVNSGKFQDGKGDMIRLTNNDNTIKIEIVSIDQNGAEKVISII